MSKETENKDLTSNDAKPLLYEEIYVGLKVIDEEGHCGNVTEVLDIHNIVVKLENGGEGIYCLNKRCCNDKLYFFI